ncbi:hypothetical protein DBR11_13165 [Pedobacter sp. HMWF019]|nr:hypothetical protein DBR11_13165 [Pedobacter sp. HMWF019]
MMKIVKIVSISVFIAIIMAETYMLFIKELSDSYSHILLMLIIIFLLLYRSKLTWAILFVICTYGVFDFFNSTHKNVPTFMDFTAMLNFYFFNESSGMLFHRICKVYPLIFYLGTSIAVMISYFKRYNVKS